MDHGKAMVRMAIGEALVHLAPWPPKLIDISCPEDLWSHEAAEVPMLASPSGWGSSMSSVLARQLSREPVAEERQTLDAEASLCVQDHINSVMSLSARTRRLETQANVDAAVDRAAERTQSGQDDPDGLMDRERLEEEEKLEERAGEALRAAALRRASEEKLAVQQLATSLPIYGSVGHGYSTASGTTGTPSSSMSEVSDYAEESVSAQQVQEQIRRAAEAARERRTAEADGFGDRIRQAAEDAWKRRTVYEEAPWTAPNMALSMPPDQLQPMLMQQQPLQPHEQQNLHEQQLFELQRMQTQQELRMREQQQLQQQQLQRQVQQQLQQQQPQAQSQQQLLSMQPQQPYPAQEQTYQQQQQFSTMQSYTAQQQPYTIQQQPYTTQQQPYPPQQQPFQQHQPYQQQYQQQQQYPQQQSCMPFQQQASFAFQAPQAQPGQIPVAGYTTVPSMASLQGPLATMPSQGAPYNQAWAPAYMDSKAQPLMPPPLHNAPQFGGC